MYGFLSGFYFFVFGGLVSILVPITYSNTKVKTSRLHDTQIVMNKGEINTGESNENEDVHKFNESVVLTQKGIVRICKEQANILT
jgi:hypothetical protein